MHVNDRGIIICPFRAISCKITELQREDYKQHTTQARETHLALIRKRNDLDTSQNFMEEAEMRTDFSGKVQFVYFLCNARKIRKSILATDKISEVIKEVLREAKSQVQESEAECWRVDPLMLLIQDLTFFDYCIENDELLKIGKLA